MKKNNVFSNLDDFASKLNVLDFKKTFNSLKETDKNFYIKNNFFKNKNFEENKHLLTVFKRGISILDKDLYSKLCDPQARKTPLSADIADLENYLTGVIMSLSDNDELIKKIASIISQRKDELTIMEFVKKIDEDIYKKILANLPDAKRIENKMKNNCEDDDDSEASCPDPFFEEEISEINDLLESQYSFKAEALSLYYEELKSKNLPSHMISKLLCIESSTLDSLIGRK